MGDCTGFGPGGDSIGGGGEGVFVGYVEGWEGGICRGDGGGLGFGFQLGEFRVGGVATFEE